MRVDSEYVNFWAFIVRTASCTDYFEPFIFAPKLIEDGKPSSAFKSEQVRDNRGNLNDPEKTAIPRAKCRRKSRFVPSHRAGDRRRCPHAACKSHEERQYLSSRSSIYRIRHSRHQIRGMAGHLVRCRLCPCFRDALEGITPFVVHASNLRSPSFVHWSRNIIGKQHLCCKLVDRVQTNVRTRPKRILATEHQLHHD